MTNPLYNPRGNCCTHCGEKFIFSFISFGKFDNNIFVGTEINIFPFQKSFLWWNFSSRKGSATRKPFSWSKLSRPKNRQPQPTTTARNIRFTSTAVRIVHPAIRSPPISTPLRPCGTKVPKSSWIATPWSGWNRLKWSFVPGLHRPRSCCPAVISATSYPTWRSSAANTATKYFTPTITSCISCKRAAVRTAAALIPPHPPPPLPANSADLKFNPHLIRPLFLERTLLVPFFPPFTWCSANSNTLIPSTHNSFTF